MFLAIIFSFRNEIYAFYSVIHGFAYTAGVGYVRSYTIIEVACRRSVTQLARKGTYISRTYKVVENVRA